MKTVCKLFYDRPSSFLQVLCFLIGCLSLSACSVVRPAFNSISDNYNAPKAKPQRGIAMHYSLNDQGNPTASGEPYNHSDFTASHRSLPFGQSLVVLNPANGKSVVVRINDRPNPTDPELITLSGAAAASIGILQVGSATVDIAPYYGEPTALSVQSPTPESTIQADRNTYYPPAALPPAPTYNSSATGKSNPTSNASFENWTVQVGAPNNPAFAQDHQRKLGQMSWIEEKKMTNGTRYHIYYGRFNTRAEAENAKATLISKGYTSAFIKSTLDL